MDNLQDLYERAIDAWSQANQEFWQVHDRLRGEGVEDVRSHPDYIAANQKCEELGKMAHEAYRRLEQQDAS